MRRWSRWEWRCWWDTQLDYVCLVLAFHLPRRLVSFCAVRVGLEAATGQVAPELTFLEELRFLEALDRWDAPR